LAGEGSCSSGPIARLAFRPLDAIAEMENLGLHCALNCRRSVGGRSGACRRRNRNGRIFLDQLYRCEHTFHSIEYVRAQIRLLALDPLEMLFPLPIDQRKMLLAPFE
jgi:hypothetical protein